MKILVTGAAGFIGMHTSIALLDQGFEVVGIDNLNDYYTPKLKHDRLNNIDESVNSSNFTFINIDISNKEEMVKLFENNNFVYVIHLAAQAGVRYSIENPMVYAESNIVGFVNILECCRYNNIKHLIYASSSSVYGGNEKMPFSESDNVDHPISLYAATKKANELMAHTYSHLFDLPTTGLRFFTVYGPWGRPDMAPMLFANAILQNKPIKVYNHGDMLRDFTYISDIVEGIVSLMNYPPVKNIEYNKENASPSSSWAPYRVFNIGNNKPIKLLDFINTLEDALGKKAIKNFMDIQPGDVKATFADTSELEGLTGFKPNTSLTNGVKSFADWYVSWTS